MRKTPRIISRDVKTRVGIISPLSDAPVLVEDYVKPPDTEADRVFRLIVKYSEEGYRFADNEYGMSWIRREDIEEHDAETFVVRFRCPPERMGEVYFGKMAEKVCKDMNCQLHIFHETRYEFRIPYEECIWVIQKDENLAIGG